MGTLRGAGPCGGRGAVGERERRNFAQRHYTGPVLLSTAPSKTEAGPTRALHALGA